MTRREGVGGVEGAGEAGWSGVAPRGEGAGAGRASLGIEGVGEGAGDDELFVLADEPEHDPDEPGPSAPRLAGRGARQKASRTRRPEDRPRSFTPEQRLLILDLWLQSKLPAGDFAPLVEVSSAALYKWKRLFEEHGPAGLEESRGAPAGSRLSEVARRAILLLKRTHPDWGQDRLHHELARAKGLAASPGAIARVLAEEGYEVEQVPTRPHPDKVRRFERARPGQLWQTDMFTFVLKRQNRRVHMTAYLDDHSRFVVGFGVHASASGALVREVFEAAIAAYGAPEEVLTDNGPQYVTWRGKSAFTRLCERRGIRQVVARPRRPQTLGKVERFWGTLWRECVESAVFVDLEDARARIGHFVDHYNFHRTHQGIEGAVPADRFFEASPAVKATLLARVAHNALELAQHGAPRKPFYLTGRVGDVGISLHAEGERVVLTREDGGRETVDLGAPGRRSRDDGPGDMPRPVAVTASPPELPGTDDDGDDDGAGAPGASPLDGVLDELDVLLVPDDDDDDDDDDDGRGDGLDDDGEATAETDGTS